MKILYTSFETQKTNKQTKIPPAKIQRDTINLPLSYLFLSMNGITAITTRPAYTELHPLELELEE